MSNSRLLRNFQRVYQFDHWFRQRLTPTGKLLLGTCLGAAVLGIDTRRTVAYQIFVVLAVLFLLAWLYSLRIRLPLTLQRKVPKLGTVGEVLPYQVVCHHPGTTPLGGLVIQEQIPVNFPSRKQFQAFVSQQDRQRNWFDRKVGYPRWLQLIRQLTLATAAEHPLPTLMPGPTTLTLTLKPLQRGSLTLPHLALFALEPLALIKAKRIVATPPDLIWIYPKCYPIPALQLSSGRRYQPGGVALANSIGESNEFLGLRDYRPGDALRHIHWRSWAKTGKPIVKEYQDEFFTRYGIVLDTFTAPGPAFEAAVSTAASLIYSIQNQEVLIDLMLIGQHAYCFTTGRGLSSLDQMLRVLASVQATPEQEFEQLAHNVLQRAGALSECIAVLTAWDLPRQQWISRIRQAGISIRVLIVQPTALLPEPATLPPQVYALDADALEMALRELSL